MLERKLEIFKEDGIEKGFQIRKKFQENRSVFGNGNIGDDGFYKYGDKYCSNRSLFNYFINKEDEIILHVGEGVLEKISKDNNIGSDMKKKLFEIIKNYKNNKIEEKAYSTA